MASFPLCKVTVAAVGGLSASEREARGGGEGAEFFATAGDGLGDGWADAGRAQSVQAEMAQDATSVRQRNVDGKAILKESAGDVR